MPVVTDSIDYTGFYEISSYGRVRTLKRNFLRRGGKSYSLRQKLRKPSKTSEGYRIVNLCNRGSVDFKDGGRRFLVHRLVAWAFLENKNPKILVEVNHKDGNKSNNWYKNLEWATPKQNRIHSYANGFQVPKTKPVLQLNLDGKQIKKWPSLSVAAKHFSVPVSCISRVCSGSRDKAAGFVWRFCSEC